MSEVQVYDDALGREKPKTFIEFQQRLIPTINEHYADLDIGSAMVTRGGENIRYNNLLSEAVKITGYPVSDPLRTEFFRDYHFWTGIPTSDMLQWKPNVVIHIMTKVVAEKCKEDRERK